mgnify:CR=1 FL=1
MMGLLKILTIALSVAGVVMLVMGLGRSLQVRNVRRRLMLRLQAGPLQQLGKLVTSRTGTGRASSVINMLSRLSLPQTGWRDSEMLLRFIRAGFRQPNAPRVYFAVKTGMILGVFLSVALLMPILSPHASWAEWLIAMLSLALAANFLPDLYLRIRTSERAQRMQDALPDIIDLAKAESARTGRVIGIYPEAKYPMFHNAIGLPIEARLIETLHKAGYNSATSPAIVQSSAKLSPRNSVRRSPSRMTSSCRASPGCALA